MLATSIPTQKIIGILLAAGSSRRFHGDKRLHPLISGRPMAIESALHLRAAVDSLLVVIRPDDPLTPLVAEIGVDSIVNPDPSRGMGSSLALAVCACAEAQGWVVALADMPYIAVQTHRAVVSALRSGEVLVAPSYRGRRGHPVGFGRHYQTELRKLSGDSGARAIISRDRQRLTLLERDDPGVLWDIDQPQDLVRDSTVNLHHN